MLGLLEIRDWFIVDNVRILMVTSDECVVHIHVEQNGKWREANLLHLDHL